MQYLETPPGELLAHHVKCYWSLEYAGPAFTEEPEAVLPDGCMEIVFNLSDRFQRYDVGGVAEVQPSALVAGQLDRPIKIAPTGNVRLFGIRFLPAGAAAFFRFSISELRGRIESLEDVWGPHSFSILERLADAESFARQIAIAETELAARMRTRPDASWIAGVVEHISNAGDIRIRRLANEFGTTERTLERRFASTVGLPPKVYSRLVRFQKVVAELRSAPAFDAADLAYRSGYFDQAHFINDFRQFSGASPAAFVQSVSGLTEAFLPTN